ncbi:MAG: hypothetical protein U0269_18625 [Polyangiales bacterium]
MGSDLFRATVLERKGPTVRVRYEIVHPDVFAIEDEKNIALQTIVDSYWKCREGYLWDTSPAVVKRATELAKAHPRRAQLDEWVAMAHGRQVELTPEQYAALQSGEHDGPRYTSWGTSNGRTYATLETEYQGFLAESERAIVSVSLSDEVNHPRDEGDGRDPSAVMTIKVADGLVLQHLFKDLAWDSRIYDFTGYA